MNRLVGDMSRSFCSLLSCLAVCNPPPSTAWCKIKHAIKLKTSPAKLREQDTSATRHFGTTKFVPKFKPNQPEVGRSVPVFPRSRHSCWSVSCHVFGVEVSWDRCRSVPDCLDAEVSDNPFYCCTVLSYETVGACRHHTASSKSPWKDLLRPLSIVEFDRPIVLFHGWTDLSVTCPEVSVLCYLV